MAIAEIIDVSAKIPKRRAKINDNGIIRTLDKRIYSQASKSERTNNTTGVSLPTLTNFLIAYATT